MYYVMDYWTDEIIDITYDYDAAVRLCSEHEWSYVETINDEVLYYNALATF